MHSAKAQPGAICAVVVTYHPPSSLAENLKCLMPQVAEILVVDNGSEETASVLLQEIENQLGVRIIRNKTNLGIAAALNLGIRHVIAAGYQWVATFDQDSTVTPGFFKAMLLAHEACSFKNEVALISPVLCTCIEECEKLCMRDFGEIYSLTRTAMTSGSLIKTSIFPASGYYDEGLFIDYVDYDFCLRLGNQGWRLIRARQAYLLHRLGSAETHSLLGLKVSIKSHSPWRRYHIMRNRMIIYRRYALSAPFWCLNDFGWIFLELTKILLFERDKGAKLRNMLKGIAHGLAGKTGQLQKSAA